MTVQIPQDTVDSVVYVKTPRSYSAVTMDPWTSSTWRKPWNRYHTPNKVTKDKLNRFAQHKTYKGISLNRTAGRQGQDRRNGWSPRPTKKYNPRVLGLISGPCPSHFSRQVQLNKIGKEDEECSPNPMKRAREATPFVTHEAPLEISTDEEEDQDKTSPTSPPDHERGHPTVHEYQSKSPVYPPPSDSSDDEDFSSMPDLVTPEEGMSPVIDHSNDSGYETHGSAPADVNADQDSFQDKDRQTTLAQALEKELHKAPWQKQLATGPIDDLKKMTKTVRPVYEGFWYDSDQGILTRLDQAAKKLKERRNDQEDSKVVLANSNPEKSCPLCDEPMRHHVLQCSKETLKDNLKEVIHSTPS